MGLLLLRIVIAAATIMRWAGTFTSYEFHLCRAWIPALIAIAASITLLVGFLTPIVSAGVTLDYLVISSEHLFAVDTEQTSSSAAAFLPCVSIAFALRAVLGPGAFSLDARVFGRREIVIREGRR